MTWLVTTKPSIHRSTLTGHWVVKANRDRQGWRRWDDAVKDALSKVRGVWKEDEL